MSSPIAVEKMAVPEAEDLRSLVEPFGFEERFDSAGFHRWFRARWWWSAVFSAAYVLLVFGGRSLMRHREPFRLRLPLVLWNTGLAVFSILGALRTNVTLTHIILQKGFLFSVCEPLLLTGPVTGFWAAAYSISKVVEFGDTFFIVLRKQPLILLHWYHHVSVCMFNWYAYSELAGPVGYFVAMNYTVHAVMYSYFAVRAAGYRLPRKLSMAITVLQSSQMVGGLLVGGYAHLTYQSGEACHWSDFASLLCVAMYGSYLVLFLHFFVKSYVSKTPRPKKD
ncbi:very long chain fatty acid elongase 6-like [Branchiostoma floridae x Branchiostoma japonicum]